MSALKNPNFDLFELLLLCGAAILVTYGSNLVPHKGLNQNYQLPRDRPNKLLAFEKRVQKNLTLVNIFN